MHIATRPSILISTIAALVVAKSAVAAEPPNESAGAIGNATHCTLRYDMDRWSAIYRHSERRGTITCDNGQTMYGSLEAHGAGLTAGNAKIRGATGKFSEVTDIGQLLGDYGGVAAHAGAVKSAQANVVTNGDISLALAGTGTGWDLGVTAGSFEIHRAVDAAS